MQVSPFLAGLLGNIVIAFGIIILIFLADKIRKKTMKQMDNIVAFTVGLIIAIVFLGFLPEIIEEAQIAPDFVGFYFIGGILLFYVLELFLHWHHCKDIDETEGMHHVHEHKNSSLMFLGTFVHNALH